MDIDLNRVPFSRYGSYFTFSVLPAQSGRLQGLYFRTVHGGASSHEIARLELTMEGQPVPYTIQATPACLRLEAQGGVAENMLPKCRPGATAHSQFWGAADLQPPKFRLCLSSLSKFLAGDQLVLQCQSGIGNDPGELAGRCSI